MDALKVHWFPGHMAKTRKLIESNLKMVDVIVELLDARIPNSSKNPEIDRLINNKPRVVILNKADLAAPEATARWLKYYKSQKIIAIAVDCKSGRGLNNLTATINSALSELIERRKLKGTQSRPIRMMIVGIPNVGKSSFINRIAGNRRAKVEDRPGVTRGKQWVSLENGIELLDMPGVLWPKIEDPIVGERLAFVGSVRDQILDVEYMSMRLLGFLNESYPQLLSRFKIEIDEAKDLDPYDLLELVAKKRGMIMAGGVANTERASVAVMDEYRGGKLGPITLEFPPRNIKTDDPKKENTKTESENIDSQDVEIINQTDENINEGKSE